MTCKCKICGINDVANFGDICDFCAIGQDPYMSVFQDEKDSNSIHEEKSQPELKVYYPESGKRRKVLLGGGSELLKDDVVNNYESEEIDGYHSQHTISTHNSNSGAVSGTTHLPTSSNSKKSGTSATGALTSGVTKNISQDTQKKSALTKLFRTLFKGIPFTIVDDITLFQVFPDYAGTAFNAMGNACDQVIVYGKVPAGSIAENNAVEIFGHRDSDNNIVAKTIVNKASGTTVTPSQVIPVGVIWALTIAAFAAMAFFIASYGVTGVICAAIILLILTNLGTFLKIILVILGLFLFRRKR